MLSQLKTRIDDTHVSLKEELEEEKKLIRTKLDSLFENFHSEMKLDWDKDKIKLISESNSSSHIIGFRFTGGKGFSTWGSFLSFDTHEKYKWIMNLSTDLVGTYTDDRDVQYNIFKNTAKIVDAFYCEKDKIYSFLNEAKKMTDKISSLEKKITIVEFFRDNYSNFLRDELVADAWNKGLAKLDDNKSRYMHFKSFSGHVDKIVFTKNPGKETYNVEFYCESALLLNTDRVSEQNMMNLINTFFI